MENWFAYVLLVPCMFRTCCSFLVPVSITTEGQPICTVDERFLSITIDSGNFVHHFKSMDFKNKRFQTLTKGLNSYQNPQMYLRIGGSDADHIIFNGTAAFYFNRDDFNKLYQFSQKLNWRMIFDLNSLIRNSDGTWDPSNAKVFIDFIRTMGYSIDYQLGNEPDLYPHINITIPPEQLAIDYHTLKEILNSVKEYRPLLIGPDMATLTRYNYFERFLSSLEKDVLDRVSFHHYYSASTNVSCNSKLCNFTSIEYLDRFLSYGLEALGIIRRSFAKIAAHPPPVWIGETSSTYGGGNKEIGCSFVAGFVWLDKLGLAAQMNISMIARQALKGGAYSLIDGHYYPCPDYWITVLYKQLVGNRVLNVTGYLRANRTLRLYAHCVNKNNERGYSSENIVLFALNVNMSAPAELQLADEKLKDVIAEQYLFTSSEEGNLASRFSELNGRKLKMVSNKELPELKPVEVKEPFYLPPHSYAFYVLKDIKVEVCSRS